MKKTLILFFIISLLFELDIIACSIVSIKSGDNIFIGRNFDWNDDGGEVCFFKGSSSFAHFTIHQLGEGMPYEGINEFGLFIGQAAIHSTRAVSSFTLLKKSTTSLGIMKKVLERTKSVEQAINEFKKYNILFGNFLGFPMIHYLVADKFGDSAVIEYVDGELSVIRKNQQNYQLVTNFLLSEFPPDEALSHKLFYRTRLAIPFLENLEQYSIKDVRQLTQLISQSTSLMPGIKLIFDGDNKYSYEEIQKIYLINQALPPEIMEAFNKNESYSPEEIGNALTVFLNKKNKIPAYTIWTSIYTVKDGEINIELYHKRDWSNPRRFDFTQELKSMKKQVDCKDLKQLFGIKGLQ